MSTTEPTWPAFMSDQGAPPASDIPVPVAPVAPWQLRFSGLLAAELRKIITVTSTWVLIGISVLLALLMTGLTSSALRNLSEVNGVPGAGFTSLNVSDSLAGGPVFPGLLMALLGVLTITNEYSSGMIRTSLSIAPARWPVLAAKTVVVAVIAFGTTLVGELIGSFLAMGLLGSGAHYNLFSEDGLHVWFGSSFDVMMLALMGLAFGVLLRRTAGAVMVHVVGLMLVLPVLVLFIAGVSAGSTGDVSSISFMFRCPTMAAQYVFADALTTNQSLTSMFDTIGVATPGTWSSVLTMLIWTFVPLGGAFALFQRRDV